MDFEDINCISDVKEYYKEYVESLIKTNKEKVKVENVQNICNILDMICSRLKIELKYDQYAFILQSILINQPVALNATAGSGKTTVCLIIALINDIYFKSNPSKFLVLSFNSQIAHKMSDKYLKLASKLGKYETVFAKSLNAISNNKVIDYGHYLGYSNLNIKSQIDEDDAVKIFTQSYRQHFNLRSSKSFVSKELMRKIYGFMCVCREGFWFDNPEKIIKNETFKSLEIEFKDFVEIKDDFILRMKSSNVLDFTAMQEVYLHLLKTNQECRIDVQNSYDYIFLDEVQDVTRLQFELVKEMVSCLKNTNNFFCAGDGDQNINNFRGSYDLVYDAVQNELGAKLMNLKFNLRTPNNIVHKTNLVLARNTIYRSREKSIGRDEEGNIVVFSDITPQKIAKRLAVGIFDRFCKEFNMSVKELSRILVCYRTNLEGQLIVQELLNKGLSVYTNLDFSQSKALKDILDICHFCCNEQEINGFSEIFPKLSKYIKDSDSLKIKNILKVDRIPVSDIKIDGVHKSEMVRVENLIKKVRLMINRDNSSISEIAKEIFPSYWEAYYSFYCKRRAITDIEIEEEKSFIFSMVDITPNKYRVQIDKYKSKLEDCKRTGIGITCSTINSVKGDEFDYVYCFNFNSKTFPNKSYLSKMENKQEFIEQESLLFNVALTRAKKEIVISYPKNSPSRFLVESGLLVANEKEYAKKQMMIEDSKFGFNFNRYKFYDMKSVEEIKNNRLFKIVKPNIYVSKENSFEESAIQSPLNNLIENIELSNILKSSINKDYDRSRIKVNINTVENKGKLTEKLQTLKENYDIDFLRNLII